MRTESWNRLAAWVTVLGALLALAWPRFELSYDLGLFLPAPQNADQRVLVERLGQAPGSRYLLLAVPDEPERVRALRYRIRRCLLDEKNPPDAAERTALKDDLYRAFTALQAYSYPGDYLLEHPSLHRRALRRPLPAISSGKPYARRVVAKRSAKSRPNRYHSMGSENTIRL